METDINGFNVNAEVTQAHKHNNRFIVDDIRVKTIDGYDITKYLSDEAFERIKEELAEAMTWDDAAEYNDRRMDR